MASFFNQFLKQLATGDEIRDYQHAARTFVDGLYRLSPKSGAMFHVFVDLNTNLSGINQNSQVEIGMMAKNVQLPRFTVSTKTYNAYNRKSIAQEKITYDPVSITFHDDSSDIVRDFWQNYYRYYYRDADHSLPAYNQDYKYKQRQSQDWGFSPIPGDGTPNYINSIRIYSLHQHYYSAYYLIRPIITNFQHGQHTSGEYVPLENSMTVAYEAIKYDQGAVVNGSVLGFGGIHYDNTPSPLTSIGGGTTSILGPGGLVEGIGDTFTNLENGNYLGAALGALRTANNFKNTNLTTVAAAELTQIGSDILKGQNPQSSIFVPTSASIKDGLAKALSGNPGQGSFTNTGNMNSQNVQLPNSNQGTTRIA